MTQKLFAVSMTNDQGDTTEFNLVAADGDEAMRLFADEVVGTYILGEEIVAAIEIGAPLSARIFRILDTGHSAEVLPSRIIPWEEIGVEHRYLQVPNEEEAPTP